jgi:hypothetical protein
VVWLTGPCAIRGATKNSSATNAVNSFFMELNVLVVYRINGLNGSYQMYENNFSNSPD